MNFLQVEEILMMALERNSKIENKTKIKKEETFRKNWINYINCVDRYSCSYNLFLLPTEGIRGSSMEMDYFWPIFNQ